MTKKRRPKGSGSITFEKARNTYLASIRDPLGNRLQKRFKTKDQAESWLVEHRHQFSMGTYTPESDLTYGQWLLEYLKVFKFPNIRLSTRGTYLSAAKGLAPLYEIKLKKLTPIILQGFINEHPDGFYKNTMLNILFASLKKAFQLGYLKKDLTIVLTRRHTALTKTTDIISSEEMITLSNYVKSKNFKDYVLLCTFYSTGIRRGEALALTWESVDLKNKTITIKQSYSPRGGITAPKNNSSYRTISISEHLASLLVRLKKHQTVITSLVFHNKDGQVYQGLDTKKLKRYSQQAGVKYHHIHAYRHTHASILLNSGLPITDISKRLGHSNPNITLAIYSHVIKEDIAAKSSLISKIFDNVLVGKR